MTNKELFSVGEFAKKVGVSTQAIYKQLDNKLFPYLTTVDNRKMIKAEALSLFSTNQNNNQVGAASPLEIQQDWQLILNEKDERIKELKERNEELKEQLEKQTKQNEHLIILLSQQQTLTLQLQEPKEKGGFFSKFKKRKSEKE